MNKESIKKMKNFDLSNGKRRSKYVISGNDSNINIHRNRRGYSLLSKTNSGSIDLKHHLGGSNIHFDNYFPTLLDKKYNKEGEEMRLIRIKRWIKRNWGLVVGILLILLFYYLLVRGKA